MAYQPIVVTGCQILFIHMLDIYDLQMNRLQVTVFLHEPELICLYTVEWFQVLLFNSNNSIQHYSFIYTLLKGSKYCYVILIIQFNSK